MKKINLFLLVFTITALFSIQNLWAYGVGVSTFPLNYEKHMLTTEFTGITSEDGGVGLQGRYTAKVNKHIILDAGAGISSGPRTNRFFAGADYEIFPDYMNQPKLSTKVTIENANEYKERRNILGITPIVSKGFNFWGHEGFPFVSLPVTLNLLEKYKTYESTVNITAGMIGRIPFREYKQLTGSLEVTASLKDSYSGFTLGISYAL